MHRLPDPPQEHSDRNEIKFAVSRSGTSDLQLSHLPNSPESSPLLLQTCSPGSESTTILSHNHHTLPCQEETSELLYPRVEQHN